MTRQVNQPSANRPDAVAEGRGPGGRWRVRVLEGVIFILVGLNAYLVYSVATSSAFSMSAERSVEAVVDPSAFHIQVEVLNGCGERGIGQQAMRFLRERGFDVVNIDNADHFEYRETVVLDRRGTDGPSEAARAVGNALGTQYVLLQRNDDRLVDVSVVIGKDYGELLFSVENE
ncbi:MAG: LytR C-terminal domain-containing protein [Gemmatimonadetes bacterium]|nr:LytR C-terminal domain-containing protein [Gemmatimonadota bacterium]